MANTTFSGPVRSENGFQIISTNSTTGAQTVIGIYAGPGAPTIAAAKGSFYLRTDGSSASTRMYVSDGGTTWISVTTAS